MSKPKIEKICKKCKINLCSKCQHNCKEIINIKEFQLSKDEINEFKKIFKFLNDIFEKAEKNNINSQIESSKTYQINKDLYIFAKIIFSTYLEKAKKKKLCYEIIQNCKQCLRFNDKEILLNKKKEKITNELVKKIILLYNNPEKLLLIPSYIVNLSKIKLLSDYKIKEFNYKGKNYICFAELSNNKFALSASTYICFIDIFDSDSLKKIFSIEIEDEDNYAKRIFCLKNGDLMVIKNQIIIIFKILEQSYEKILELNIGQKILNAIKLDNNKIIVYTRNNDLLTYSFNNNSQNLELENIINIYSKEEEEVYYSRLVDIKDSENIMVLIKENMGYLNYKKGIYTEKSKKKADGSSKYNFTLFKKKILFELKGYISIRDKKTSELINSFEMEKSPYKVYELKDGSLLFEEYKNKLFLTQYIYDNNNLIRLDSKSFDNKYQFNVIGQLKNGNIILSSSDSIYILQ